MKQKSIYVCTRVCILNCVGDSGCPCLGKCWCIFCLHKCVIHAYTHVKRRGGGGEGGRRQGEREGEREGQGEMDRYVWVCCVGMCTRMSAHVCRFVCNCVCVGVCV